MRLKVLSKSGLCQAHLHQDRNRMARNRSSPARCLVICFPNNANLSCPGIGLSLCWCFTVNSGATSYGADRLM